MHCSGVNLLRPLCPLCDLLQHYQDFKKRSHGGSALRAQAAGRLEGMQGAPSSRGRCCWMRGGGPCRCCEKLRSAPSVDS